MITTKLVSISDMQFAFITEFAARVCYNSLDKMYSDTNGFIKRLAKSGHLSTFEHYTMTFDVSFDHFCYNDIKHILEAVGAQGVISVVEKDNLAMTVNMRHLLEHDKNKCFSAMFSEWLSASALHKKEAETNKKEAKNE